MANLTLGEFHHNHNHNPLKKKKEGKQKNPIWIIYVEVNRVIIFILKMKEYRSQVTCLVSHN